MNADAVITVTDMSGRIVASGDGTSLNISQLPTGIYMVKAHNDKDVATIKIAR